MRHFGDQFSEFDKKFNKSFEEGFKTAIKVQYFVTAIAAIWTLLSILAIFGIFTWKEGVSEQHKLIADLVMIIAGVIVLFGSYQRTKFLKRELIEHQEESKNNIFNRNFPF